MGVEEIFRCQILYRKTNKNPLPAADKETGLTEELRREFNCVCHSSQGQILFIPYSEVVPHVRWQDLVTLQEIFEERRQLIEVALRDQSHLQNKIAGSDLMSFQQQKALQEANESLAKQARKEQRFNQPQEPPKEH